MFRWPAPVLLPLFAVLFACESGVRYDQVPVATQERAPAASNQAAAAPAIATSASSEAPPGGACCGSAMCQRVPGGCGCRRNAPTANCGS